MATKKIAKFKELQPGNKFICPDTTELSGVNRTYVRLELLIGGLYNAVDLRCGTPVEIDGEEVVITIDF